MSRPPSAKEKMKQCFTIIGLAFGLALNAISAGNTYVTQTNAGTTSAVVNFAADPQAQIRLCNVIGTSDKASAVFSFRTGTGKYLVGGICTAAGTNVTITSTNGLVANDLILIQRADGLMTNVQVFSITTSNVNFTSSASLALTNGDALFELSAATALPCGTNSPIRPTAYSGEAVYSGNLGRPVRIVLDGTSACSIDAATAVYQK